MPQIEELQSSYKAAAPGWSYVVDTGYDPSKAAINPTSRKRLRTSTAAETSATETTLRQQTAIQRHLAQLDRDNHKDVQIPLPKSHLDSRKSTTNAKRVLGSGKDFAYYIEEEEALLATHVRNGPVPQTTESGPGASKIKSAQRPSKTPYSRRKEVMSSSTAPSSSGDSTPVPTPTIAQVPVPPSAGSAHDSSNDLLPLLEARKPLTISDAEIEALLSQPPLTYNAARSAPPPAGAPPRRVFCEICGYWGRSRCMKCGARLCSIDCRATHDESRCIKFYA